MSSKSVLIKKAIFFPALFILLLILGGTAAAQHEGGLGGSKVHLNIAMEDQLLTIEGMTEELAEAIVAHRDESGFFEAAEDLLEVPGMTRNVFKQLDPQVGTEGDLYCVPAEGEDDDDDWDDEPILSPSKC